MIRVFELCISIMCFIQAFQSEKKYRQRIVYRAF